MAQADELLTVTEAAAVLERSVSTLYSWRTANTGPLSHRRRGRLVYRRSDLDAFVTRERESSTRGGIA